MARYNMLKHLRVSALLLVCFLLQSLTPVMFGQGHTPYWNHKASMYSILPNNSGEIIFLGDSITDRCEWFELFSNTNVRNRGLSGDKTSGVLDRLSEVTESKPDKIFLMIGVNDLRHSVPFDTIVSNYRKIINQIIEDSPQTEIYLQSVLPVNNQVGDSRTANWKITNFNNKIKLAAQELNLTYIDINSHMVNSELRLKEEFTEDGLHINGAGYEVWSSLIENYVNN